MLWQVITKPARPNQLIQSLLFSRFISFIIFIHLFPHWPMSFACDGSHLSGGRDSSLRPVRSAQLAYGEFWRRLCIQTSHLLKVTKPNKLQESIQIIHVISYVKLVVFLPSRFTKFTNGEAVESPNDCREPAEANSAIPIPIVPEHRHPLKKGSRWGKEQGLPISPFTNIFQEFEIWVLCIVFVYVCFVRLQANLLKVTSRNCNTCSGSSFDLSPPTRVGVTWKYAPNASPYCATVNFVSESVSTPSCLLELTTKFCMYS